MGNKYSWGSKKQNKFTTIPPPHSRGFKTDLSIEEKITPVQRQLSSSHLAVADPNAHRPASRMPSKSSIITYDNQSQKYTSPLDKIRKMRLSLLSNHTANDNDDENDGPSTSAGIWGLATSVFPRRSMRPQPPLSGTVGKRVSPHKRQDSDAYSVSNDDSSSSTNPFFAYIPTPRIDDFYDTSMSTTNSKAFSDSSNGGSFHSSSPIRPPFAYRNHGATPSSSPSMSSLSQITWLNTVERNNSNNPDSSVNSPVSASFNTATEGYDSSRNSSTRSRSTVDSDNGSRPPVFPRTSDTVFGRIIAERESAHDFGPPRNDYQPVIVEEEEDENTTLDEDARREEAMSLKSPKWKQNARSFLQRTH